MQRFALLNLVIPLVCAVPLTRILSSDQEDSLWLRFKISYQRAYFDSAEEFYRKGVFLKNVRLIDDHNSKYDDGKFTFSLAMNEFGDVTFEEFVAKHTGYHSRDSARREADSSVTDPPDSVDWSAKGAVTPVKNQGQCGSCWAFAGVAAIESAWFIAKGQLVSLSEQQLMDCCRYDGGMGCEGGALSEAYKCVIRRHGICPEQEYPYHAKDVEVCGNCTMAVTISSYTDVKRTEDALVAAVAQQPTSVAIEADQPAFQFYSRGVLTGQCGTNYNHAVLAVGYGSLQGIEYWKLKNSWGAGWGMNGYVLIARNVTQAGGECGINLAASYPTV